MGKRSAGTLDYVSRSRYKIIAEFSDKSSPFGQIGLILHLHGAFDQIMCSNLD